MSSPAVTTLVKMMEALPETVQDQVVRHLREYLGPSCTTSNSGTLPSQRPVRN